MNTHFAAFTMLSGSALALVTVGVAGVATGSPLTPVKVSNAAREGFVKFKSEDALVRFLSAHSGSTRVHPSLLWVQHNADALESFLNRESAESTGMVENSFLPNQLYFVPKKPSTGADTYTEGLQKPLPANLWGISKINSEIAWTVTKGNSNVVVAVVDTGIDYAHRALSEQMLVNAAEKNGKAGVDDDKNGYTDDVFGYNFIDKKSDPLDDQGHGSHVAGTIAGNSDKENFYGVAPEVKLLAVKTHNTDGEGSEEAVVKGILYAADRGAHVINCSWGGAPEAAKYSQLLFDAIEYANNKGALLVAAAGNDGENNDKIENYPANYELPNVLAVASTAKNDKLSFFSNYGAKKVHIAAPGSDIWSVDVGGNYVKLSGTSMAAPHMAGAAALVYSVFLKTDISAEQVRAKMVQNAKPMGNPKGKVISGLADLTFLSQPAPK